MGHSLRGIDHAGHKANQAIIAGLLIAAFVGDAIWLVLIVATIMLFGTVLGRPGFLPVYKVLRSVRLVKPDVIQDNPEPHRLAQGLGSLVLMVALAAFLAGYSVLGWLLTGVVVALAFLNLFGGLCVGCAAY